MTEHLATSERQRTVLHCELCLLGVVYPPALLCPACERYVRDCEAEVSADR